MPLRAVRFLVALGCLALAFAASAQLDSTRRAVVVRAGPDDAFPQVARLPTATNVHVIGCLADRIWCDILSGRTRGWVRLADVSQSSRVLGSPTVTFSVAEYWDAHYRRRSWYAARERWLGWGTPGFVAPAAASR